MISKTKELYQLAKRYLTEYKATSMHRLAGIMIAQEKLDISQDTLRKYLRKVKFETKIEKEEPVGLPESWYEEEPRYYIPSAYSKIAVLSDIHIPFHSNKALELALKYIENWTPHAILLNGDIFDCYALSYYLRDPNLRDVAKEVKIVKQFLEYITDRFEGVEILYKFGNHENRWQRYLFDKASELANIKEIQLERLLELDEIGIGYIPEGSIIQAGKLFIAHGHEFGGVSTLVNTARWLRLKAHGNVLAGHWHRTQEDVVTTIEDKAIGGWTVGCLCGLRPRYRRINFWNWGFATIEFSGDEFQVENKKIDVGKVL